MKGSKILNVLALLYVAAVLLYGAIYFSQIYGITLEKILTIAFVLLILLPIFIAHLKFTLQKLGYELKDLKTVLSDVWDVSWSDALKSEENAEKYDVATRIGWVFALYLMIFYLLALAIIYVGDLTVATEIVLRNFGAGVLAGFLAFGVGYPIVHVASFWIRRKSKGEKVYFATALGRKWMPSLAAGISLSLVVLDYLAYKAVIPETAVLGSMLIFTGFTASLMHRRRAGTAFAVAFLILSPSTFVYLWFENVIPNLTEKQLTHFILALAAVLAIAPLFRVLSILRSR